MVISNSPDICQGSSNCASNFLEVLSTIWQQQESEKLNKLLKQSQKSQKRKLSYCCLFFFPQWKHMYREQSCRLVSQWLTCNLLVKTLAMDAQGSILVYRFLCLSTSCIYRFAECSLQFANDCLIQLPPSSRFLWCGPNPTSRPIMTAHISAKPFLNCPQGWQGNTNIHRNSDITKKTLTSWHLSLPVLGQLLTVYFLELNPVCS